MAEIKSTLDLVLEKTMHLSLNSDEKQELAAQDVEKRIKGMLQKYQDGVLTPKEMSSEYVSISNDDKLTADHILIKVIISRLDLLEGNGPLLEALDRLGGLDTTGLQSVIDESRGSYHNAAGKRLAEIKTMLAGDYGISGSAVVPNLAVDERWHLEERELRSRFEDSLDRVKAGLMDAAQKNRAKTLAR